MLRACSLALLLACRPDCEPACDVARTATEACLDQEGLDWSARGWRGAADYETWCATVIWESARLHKDGGEAACSDASGLLEASCEDVLAWPEQR